MTVGRLPQESPAYAKIRDELQAAEVALRDQRERVAALRRTLPRDTPIEDAELREVRDGATQAVRLSELFTGADRPLILMHFMYGGSQKHPCPMCTSWADGYDDILPHLEQRADFAIFVAGDPGAFGEYARSRGWRNARIVSAGDSSIKRDLGFEVGDGEQLPGFSVFERGAGGAIHHFYSQSALLGPDGFRGMDLLNPLWHFFDALPEGRGDFMPQKSYD
jgi:predicted dithiol-disulfide oxidoreductase (DUF899 family)